MTGSSQDDFASRDDHVTGFAALMRERTKAVHRQAERAGFIADLVRGRASVRGYAMLLRNLAPAYEALETSLDAHLDTPVIRVFADPRLRRFPALTRDLVALAGPGWAASAPTPEAAAYARAVEAAAAGDGLGLVAHAYARYLGDLSGGQILKPLLARTLGLGPHALGLYDFPAFADVDTPKAALREALDDIPVAGAAAERIVAEAIAAFRHNIAVSEAVQAVLADG